MPKGLGNTNCKICNKVLGIRNKHGFCESHRSLCPERKKQRSITSSKKWFRDNPGKTRIAMDPETLKLHRSEYLKQYRDTPEFREKAAKWDRERRVKDQNYRIASSLRSRLSKALTGVIKTSSAIQDLGCTISELKLHLESLFQEGMSWGNYGHGLSKWNIDHINPLAGNDLSNPLVQKELSHFSNLQPLWHIDNIVKSNKKGINNVSKQMDVEINEGFCEVRR